MAEDFFNIAQRTDDDLVAGFRWTGRGVIYDGSGVSLALACIYRGRDMVARRLIEAGHRFGLHEAAALGDAIQVAAVLDAAPWSVDLLAPDGWSALHLAAFFGRAEAASLLLARGADASLWSRSFERNLPIHAAAAGRNHDLAILEILIPATGDIDALQGEGHSALLIAASAGKRAWVERLVRAGADPKRRTKDGKGVADLAPAG